MVDDTAKLLKQCEQMLKTPILQRRERREGRHMITLPVHLGRVVWRCLHLALDQSSQKSNHYEKTEKYRDREEIGQI